jgi:hypothetical protein
MKRVLFSVLLVACNNAASSTRDGAAAPTSDAGVQCLAQADCARACANLPAVCSAPSTQACVNICYQVELNCAASCAASTSPANAALFGCFQQNVTCANFTACANGCIPPSPNITPNDLAVRD